MGICFPMLGYAWEFFWDFIGKYNFIKDVGKLMSYIGNVHPNVGKYHGKILGLVWDFFCPQNTDFMLGIQHKKLGMFIPIL